MGVNEMFIYGCLGLGLAIMLFASQAPLLAPLGIAAACTAYLFYRWGNIYIPLVTRFQKDIRVKYAFEVTPSEDALIKADGDEYIATVFLNLDVYETMTNKSPEEMKEYSQYFERSIASLKDPIKISTTLYEKGMRSYVDSIEQEKAKVEELIAGEMGKKKIDERRLEVLRRQKLMWERRLDSLYRNPDKPKSVEYFIATSARGASRDGAVSAARIRAREIKATFSGGMSLRVDELAHNRMEACYSWEFMTPDW